MRVSIDGRLIGTVRYFLRLVVKCRTFWAAFTLMTLLCMANTFLWAYACRGGMYLCSLRRRILLF